MFASLPATRAGRPVRARVRRLVLRAGRQVRGRTRRLPARVLPVLLLVTGCSRAAVDIAGFHDVVGAGDYQAALDRLEDTWDADDVSVMLNRALLLESLGRYEESNEAFAKAEIIIDDLYTRSVSKEAFALVTNDMARDYRPPPFETAYIPYFRAWNYLQLGRRDDVLVEARRIDERLRYMSTFCPDDDGACAHHVFLRYFSGLLFEWGGETNEAYVAYRLADEARRSGGIGSAAPPDLGARLVRASRRLGFLDDAERYAEAYGVENVSAPPASVVLVFEHGVIGYKREESLTLPIFTHESSAIAADVDGWSHKVAARAHHPYDRAKLEYLLRVAVPSYASTPPAGNAVTFSLGAFRAPVPVVDPLDARAAAALDDAMGGILVRTVARGLTKYLTKKLAEDKGGEVLGLAVNLFGAVTEQADTRSWVSLPFEIRSTSVDVPAGTYRGKITVTGRGGRVITEAGIEDIEVEPGEIVFVRHRWGG